VTTAAVQAPSATYVEYARSVPTVEVAGARTWVHRSANVVLAYSEVEAGARLERAAQADEYLLFCVDAAGRLTSDAGDVDVPAEGLAIVAPGASSFVASRAGALVRVFTDRSADLVALAENGADYAARPEAVEPLGAVVERVGGPSTRVYALADHPAGPGEFRVFRSGDLMVNLFAPRDTRRPATSLSPHWHDTFEQISLTFSGRWTHHLRYPWTPDLDAWRADEHESVDSPSLTVIPATVEHTSQDIGEGSTWLVDVFGPPRADLLERGIVINNAEYDA
jgi:hypothetical protein